MAQLMGRQDQGRATPKFRVMGAQEDVEDYLLLFERHMVLNDIPEEEWTRQLAPVLTGRAGAAYNDVEPRAPYPTLKQAILRRYEITPEASSQTASAEVPTD